MSMHQYIGARYVPKFYENSLDPHSCEWESNVTYEPLTMVTLPNNHAYISKKTAPDTIGSPADNAEYWLETGNFNAYIEDLQDQVDIINNQTIPGLSDLIIGDLMQLKGKTIAIYGSSNEFDYATQGRNWTNVMSDILDGIATIVNNSIDGGTLLDCITSYIADPNKYDYDIVIWCSTRNLFKLQNQLDFCTDSMATSRIESAIDSLTPYKKIEQIFYFASCDPYRGAIQKVPMCVYDGLVEKYANQHGYRFIDKHSWLGVSDYDSYDYTHDGTHFKAEVADIYASKCIQALIDGGEHFNNYSVKLTDDAAVDFLHDYYALNPNIVSYTSQGILHSKVYIDKNLNVQAFAILKNNTGSTLTANSLIINSGGKGVFALPSNTIQELHTNYNSTDIKYTMRATGLRLETSIPDQAIFVLAWGSFDSHFKLQ